MERGSGEQSLNVRELDISFSLIPIIFFYILGREKYPIRLNLSR